MPWRDRHEIGSVRDHRAPPKVSLSDEKMKNRISIKDRWCIEGKASTITFAICVWCWDDLVEFHHLARLFGKSGSILHSFDPTPPRLSACFKWRCTGTRSTSRRALFVKTDKAASLNCLFVQRGGPLHDKHPEFITIGPCVVFCWKNKRCEQKVAKAKIFSFLFLPSWASTHYYGAHQYLVFWV